ncbi:MAG: SusC/RagA family TonB-linked outer membrane protein [Paludibacter sp.]
MKIITKYKILILLITCLFYGTSQVVWSQASKAKRVKILFTGSVKNTEGIPIENAAIYANQGDVVTKTDSEGNFSLQSNLSTSIFIEAEGYETLTINSISTNHDLVLTKSPYLSGEKDVVQMAFKNAKKSMTVGNISKINVSDILKKDNITRVQNILDTYAPGLRGGTNILGFGDALTIVDGLPRDASYLQPEEIQDITILKDVNSSLLYGSQAKNGVIVIKTKRGTANKKVINMSIESGLNTPIAMPKYLNSSDYMTLYNEAQTNDNPNKVPDYDPLEIAKYDGTNPYRYPDVDYYSSEYLKPFYNTTRFFSEFSGGNDIASYYANIGWENSGVLYKANNNVNNGSDRLRVRGNVNFNISEHIKSYIDAAFVFNKSTGIRTDYFTMASTYRPNNYAILLPVEAFEDPTITDPLTHIKNKYILGGNSNIGLNSYGKNLIGELNNAGYSRNYNNTMQFNTGLIFDLENLTKGLKVKTDISFDTYGSYAESIQNSYALYEPVWNDITGKISSIKTINTDSRTGVLNLSSGSLARTIGATLLVDYDRVFNVDHHISSSLLGYYNTASEVTVLHSEKNAHIGFQAAYDYKNCYIVDFTGAMMNSVKLAPGHRLSFSPSIGLGWVASNANFWTENKLINYLKLRASAGILQTDASASFGYNKFREIYQGGSSFGTYDGGYNFGSTYVSQTANYDLGMEKMKNLNIGFEAALFDKSLFIEASYFSTLYADQLTQRANYYPAFISTTLPYVNYNETSYSGIDISLKFQKKIGEVTLAANLNTLYSVSEYVKRDEIHNNDYQYLVGKPTDTFWGLKNLGMFATDAEAIAANQKYGTIRRGDIHYQDLDANGFIDDNDETSIGNSTPRIMSDLIFSIEYKGFSLFATASSRLGYNWMMSSSESPNKYIWVDGTTKYSEMVLNRWTDETALTATYPRLTAQTSQNNFRTSDFWMRNGNDITISRVQLNYSLPESIFKNLFIKGISAYVRGNNLLMIAQDAKLRQTSSSLNYRNFAVGFKIAY